MTRARKRGRGSFLAHGGVSFRGGQVESLSQPVVPKQSPRVVSRWLAGTVEHGIWTWARRSPAKIRKRQTREWPAAVLGASECRGRGIHDRDGAILACFVCDPPSRGVLRMAVGDGARGFQPAGRIARVRPGRLETNSVAAPPRAPFPCPKFACPIFPRAASRHGNGGNGGNGVGNGEMEMGKWKWKWGRVSFSCGKRVEWGS